jgi:signal transduction histidine kinase
VKVSVTDNGHGIPADRLEKIFDPYFSTKDTVTQKGMGLGLTICYSILKKHNGHIYIESQEGKGARVELYIPAYELT